jgi:lipoprotein-releasing system permease protein
VGDTLLLLSFGSRRDNPVLGPEIIPFRGEVTGVFHSGMFDYDNQFVYTDLESARRMAALGSAVTGIEVRVEDKWRAPELANGIRGVMEREAVLVEDWQEQNSALYSALKLEKLAMSVTVFLIVIVAAFNIVSVLTMLVRDKTREIGILRAMGMTAANIRRIFRLQGVFIGIVGTTLGLLIGLGISIPVGHYKLIELDARTYFIDYLPVRTEPRDVVLIALGSLVIAWLATLGPSAQAARLYPLEAIRDE